MNLRCIFCVSERKPFLAKISAAPRSNCHPERNTRKPTALALGKGSRKGGSPPVARSHARAVPRSHRRPRLGFGAGARGARGPRLPQRGTRTIRARSRSQALRRRGGPGRRTGTTRPGSRQAPEAGPRAPAHPRAAIHAATRARAATPRSHPRARRHPRSRRKGRCPPSRRTPPTHAQTHIAKPFSLTTENASLEKYQDERFILDTFHFLCTVSVWNTNELH